MVDSISPQSPKLKRFLKSQSRHVVVSGPRDCSKSYTIWKLITFYHENIPNFKSCIVRNEAKTIARTVFGTWARMLKYPSAEHPKNPFIVNGGFNYPSRILWDNGGITEFGGMDDPDKVLGGDYHLAWYNQVEREHREKSYADLVGCMVGHRAGPLPKWVPWRFRMISDANPGSPSHFLYKRYLDDKEKQERDPNYVPQIDWYDFTHKDHPMLFDWNLMRETEEGKHVLTDLLEAYPEGYMRDRMVYGKWVGAEGMVYQMWNKDTHVKPMQRDDFGKDTVWRWSIDIGGRDPHAIGIFAQVGDTHYLFKEICRSMIKISDVIEITESLTKRYDIPKPNAVFLDWNVKDFQLQLEELGYPVVLADKEVAPGVENVKQSLSDNKFFVNENSLEQRDPLLMSAPQGFKEEVGSYVHKPLHKRSGKPADDLPDQTNGNDHFCDLVRYYLHSLYLAPIPYEISYGESYI